MIDHALRSRGIGASEISAVLGLNPYISAFDLWARKRGLLDDVPMQSNPRMRVGKAIERGIADAYSQETGNRIVWCDTTVRHPTRQWQVATPDALLMDESGGVDCKAISFDQYFSFGEPGTDAVPDHIALQCQWSCSALDREFWDVAACSGSELRIYRVIRDAEIETMILDEGERFWRDRVLTGVAPEMKCTPTAEAYLKRKFRTNSGELRVPTGEEAQLIEEFLDCRTILNQAQRDYDDREIKLKAAIGADSGFRLHSGRITFNRTKDSMGVDHEALGRWAASEDYDRLAKQFYGVRREGVRRLDVRVKGGE